jgi:hypothetical protein
MFLDYSPDPKLGILGQVYKFSQKGAVDKSFPFDAGLINLRPKRRL